MPYAKSYNSKYPVYRRKRYRRKTASRNYNARPMYRRSRHTSLDVMRLPASLWAKPTNNIEEPGWPRVLRKQFTYNTTFGLTTNITSVITQSQWRMNSPYDPDYATGGDNAFGWDQFMGTLYDRAVVDKCYLEVTFAPQTASYSCLCGIFFTNSLTSTTITAVQTAMNQPEGQWKMAAGGGGPVTFRRVCYPKKYLPLLNHVDLTCTPSANPAADVLAHIWVADANQVDPVAMPVAVSLRLTYYCILGQTDIVPAST